jgi:hypothetical protein
MTKEYICGVWEDDLQGVIVKKIINQINRNIELYPIYSNRAKGPSGIGYIRSKWKGFYSASSGSPYILLLDLDNIECAPTLRSELGVPANNRNFIFHIAVREIETWILSDTKNFLTYFRLPINILHKFPHDLEKISDPKQFLISIMRYSKKRDYIRAIVPELESTAQVGKYYNSYLIDFIQKHWDLKNAQDKSDSLQRFIKELVVFCKR